MSWPIGKVFNIADVISGFAFKSEWFGSGSSKVIRIGDLQDGRVDLEGAKTFDEAVHHIRDQFKIKNGDILMALSGATVGKIAVADALTEGAFLNQRVAIIRGRLPENTEYLKYIFSGELLQKLLLNAGGAAQPNLSPKDLVDMEIPLPPLAEQKRIAAILDKADAIRRKRQQAIQLADDFLRAVFLDMFGDPVTNPKGWEVKPLSDFVSKLGDGLHGTPKYDSDGTYHFINGNNLKDGSIEISGKVKTVSEDEFRKHKKLLNETTMLVSINGTIGNVAFYRGERVVLGKSTCYFNVIDSLISKKYLYHLIKSDYFIRFASGEATGSTIKNISLKSMRSFPVPVPTKEIQEKFEKILNSIEGSIKQSKDSNILSSFFFDSLSQKAFSGKL